MATTVNVTTSYAGQDSKLWVKAALLSGNTLANAPKPQNPLEIKIIIIY